MDKDARKGYLLEFAMQSGELRQKVEVGMGERFHPGGMARDGESLWLPVAEYRRDIEAGWGISGFDVRVGINSGQAAVGLVGAGPAVEGLTDEQAVGRAAEVGR